MNATYDQQENLGILFIEVLNGNSIELKPKVETLGVLDGYYAHQTYDCADPNDLVLLKKLPAIIDLLN